jgi:outer membrane protein
MRAHVLAAMAVALAPSALRAEAVRVTLAEALELAARQNPDLLAARARTEAEAARAAAAKRAYWPKLSLSTGWSRANTASTVFAQKLDSGALAAEDLAIGGLNDPGALSHLTSVLRVEVPVDVFRGLRARAEAQSSSERAAAAFADDALQELRLRVIEAYRQAALAQRLVAATESALAGAGQREADVEARVAQGASLRADLLRARARRREREADLARRRGDAQVAWAVLAKVLGADPSIRYEATELPSAPPPLDGTTASWTARALASRAWLRAAGGRLDGRTWALRAEERSGRPEIAIWGQLQDDRSQFSNGRGSGAAGVVLRWGLFDAGRGRRVAAAAAEVRAAELEARAAADQLRLEVETAWANARTARERYAAAAGGAEEGREALRVVQERRRQGLATLTDELETEAAALFAELEELRAASEAAIADAALRRAAGAL